MNVIFFFTLFIILKLYHMTSIDEEFPNINELFDIPKIDDRSSSLRPPDLQAQGVTINIEKIDVNRLRRKLDKLPQSDDARQYRAFFNLSKTLFNKNGTVPSALFNDTTSPNDTRRQIIPWKSRWYHWHGTEYNTRVKIMDNALQTIYMARHKIMILERDKHFNRKDTGYRIAFIYKTMRRLYRRLVSIYMTGKKGLKKSQALIWFDHDHMAYMHQRALKIHVDFLYYYWVMLRIDNAYRTKYKITVPPGPILNFSTPDPFLNYEHMDEWLVFGG